MKPQANTSFIHESGLYFYIYLPKSLTSVDLTLIHVKKYDNISKTIDLYKFNNIFHPNFDETYLVS